MLSFKMASPLCLIFLLMISGALGNQWSVTYSQENLCAVKGSTVVMNATYTHPTIVTVTNRFWVIDPDSGTELTDLHKEPGYSGRVEYLGDEPNHISLSDVNKSDEHVYCFRIVGDKGGYTGHPGVVLNVTDLQVIIPAEVTEGESVVLTCKTTCSLTDPTFIWYKNTHDLTTNSTESNELHLQRVSSEDAGSYNCAVRGSEDLPSPAEYLSVRYSPKKLSVSISPSGEIVEGSSATLTCSSDANPPATCEWYKETKLVRKVPTYTIANVSSEDSGEYKCKCRNKVGHQYSSRLTLNVLSPSHGVSMSISISSNILEGSSVTLTCGSDANPPVETYKWFKEKQSSPVGSGQSYRALQNVQYYCKVLNKLGSVRSATVSITVNDGFVIVYVAVGLGLFGLGALLSTLLWLRWNRQKKKADEGDHQNIGLSAKDGTYAALDPAGRKSDDVYHTLTISHPGSPGDTSTSSDY